MKALIDLVHIGGYSMLAILGLSFIGWFIMLERWLEQQVSSQNTRAWERVAEPAIAAGTLPNMARLHAEWPCIESSVVLFCVRTRLGMRDFSGHLQRFMGDIAARSRRRLATIAVIAAVLPLLGLLGTVAGMIRTFTVLAVNAQPDPRMLADGITQALVTTEAGLLAALPLLLGHALLRSSLRHALDRAQVHAMQARHLCEHRKAS